MKKRFLSLVLALMLSLTLCTLTAFADNSALTLKFYNVVTSGITLEFSNELTSINASVTDAEAGTQLTTNCVIDSANKTTVHISVSPKMDITKSYILNFEALDGTNTIEKQMLIDFNVVVNDDFSSYSSLNDMTTNYVGRVVDSAPEVTDTSLGFEFDAENDRIKFTTRQKYLRPRSVNQLYYTAEVDVTSVNESLPSFEVHAHCNNDEMYWHAQAIFYGYGEVKYFQQEPTAFNIPQGEYASNKSYIISRSAYTPTAGAEYRELYIDGVLKTFNSGYSAIKENANKYNSHFAFSANGTSVYLNSLKIYTATLTDYELFSVENCEITSKFIKVNFSKKVSENELDEAITLMSQGESVATNKTLENNGKTVKIVPTSGALDLDAEYILRIDGLHDEVKATLGLYQRRFMLEKFLAEDFENCESINDLDGGYNVVFEGKNNVFKTPETISEHSKNFAIDTESNGNKRLKFTSDAGGAFTHITKYPARENWRKLIMEVDIERDSVESDWGIDLYYGMAYVNSNYSGWYNGESKLHITGGWNWNLLPANSSDDRKDGASLVDDKKVSFILAPQNGKFNVYKGDATYISQDYTPNNFPTGEFGFQLTGASVQAHYIDNIKMYKLVEDIEDQIYIAGMRKNDTQVSGTIALNSASEANVPESVLLVAIYDNNNKMLGVTTAEIDGTFKTAYIPYTVNYAVGTPTTIRAFLWESIDGMKPVALNATKTIQ